MEEISYITKKNYILYIILITAIFLIVPHMIRYVNYGELILPGDKSYYHLSISEQLLNKELSVNEVFSQAGLSKTNFNDKLIIPFRPLIITPYHLIIAAFGRYIPYISLTGIMLGLLIMFGLASVFLFDRILERFKVSYLQRFIILLLLVLSPLFLQTFLMPDQIYFVIFLQLLGFYLYTSKTTSLKYLPVKYLSLIPYVIISVFGIFHTLIAVMFILGYELFVNKKYWQIIGLSIVMIGISLYFNLPIYYKYGFIKTSILSENILQSYVTDLGASEGFGIFAIILTIFGLIKTWPEKYEKKYSWIYVSCLVLFVFSFIYHQYVNYLNFIVIILSAFGLIYLLEIKWELKIIKNFTFLIIILGILFSGVSFISRVAEMPPTQEFIDAFGWIKSNKPVDSVILSHPEYGHMIKYHTQLKVLIDSNQNLIEDYSYFKGITNTIFQSRSLKEVEELMTRFNINLIFISKEMKEGLVWDKPNQGLLFLFDNSDKFRRVYLNPYAEVWEYKKSG
ncbi:hypothetical protein J4434_08475 [Candidatus Woesearchaeota archaeon]|nr:hypothetical protein [Candidatus Woesearchaeota archaeon]